MQDNKEGTALDVLRCFVFFTSLTHRAVIHVMGSCSCWSIHSTHFI